MLKLQWEGTDWPKAKTPLTLLEVLYGAKPIAERKADDEATSASRLFHYFRINGKPSNKEYATTLEAQEAAEVQYFAMVRAQFDLYCAREWTADDREAYVLQG